MLVNGDRRWITELHFAFQDENYLVSPGLGRLESWTPTLRLAVNETGSGRGSARHEELPLGVVGTGLPCPGGEMSLTALFPGGF